MNQFDDNDWNEDVIEDTQPGDFESLVVYSRDWTVETIFSQIDNGNIDLNPKFQRRNVWDDQKRSKLIESLILGLPIPEIVLAEHPVQKKSFVVIDGKQRLLTIAGFIKPEFGHWDKPELRDLQIRIGLDGANYAKLSSSAKFQNDYRKLLNADIRCTVVSSYKKDDVLYSIFHRLNTTSVPLSTQELRQVLHRGKFADYLVEITNSPQPIHSVLKLTGPDKRLRDIETILRFVSVELFGGKYKGNLKSFLDDSMDSLNDDWEKYEQEVQRIYTRLGKAIKLLSKMLGKENIGRKYVNGKWERRFNKVLFEVEAYYFMHLIDVKITEGQKKIFIEGFKNLCDKNKEFRSSIESTTKTNERYQVRFSLFQELVNKVFRKKIDRVPITMLEE